MTAWTQLMLAILAEVVATTAMRATEEFTRLGPSLVVLVGYGVSFVMMSKAIHSLPLGVTYAIWSGLGSVGAMFTGWLIYGEAPGAGAVVGLPLIIAGTWLLRSSVPG